MDASISPILERIQEIVAFLEKYDPSHTITIQWLTEKTDAIHAAETAIEQREVVSGMLPEFGRMRSPLVDIAVVGSMDSDLPGDQAEVAYLTLVRKLIKETNVFLDRG
jgi:hypothetical protein